MKQSRQLPGGQIMGKDGGRIGTEMEPIAQRPLSPKEWGEAQYIVHSWGRTGYSPEQEALIDRALREFPTLESGIGLIADVLMDQMVRELADGYEDEYLKTWAEVGKLQFELGYFTASALERMQMNNVLIQYLRLVLENRDDQRAREEGGRSAANVAQSDRQLNAVQGRFQRASEGLARLRRLGSPIPLQINIAGQQVNLAGTSITGLPADEGPIVDVPPSD